MVMVTRVFVHDLDDDKLEKIRRSLTERFKVVKISSSEVVPNFLYIEIEGNVEDEVRDLIADLEPLDFKVVFVNV